MTEDYNKHIAKVKEATASKKIREDKDNTTTTESLWTFLFGKK
jgi:hypothetical protein